MDRYGQAARETQTVGDPPVEIGDDLAHHLLAGRRADRVGQPLDLAPQLQFGRQQRLRRQSLARQITLHPPQLVVAVIGDGFAVTGQIVEIAPVLRHADLPFDPRLERQIPPLALGHTSRMPARAPVTRPERGVLT